MTNAPEVRWNRFSQVLHWLIALLILGLGIVGLTMTEMANSPDKMRIYALHKSFGLTVLMLVGLRLVWRATHRAPPPVAMPRWQHLAAQATHGLLYVLMAAVPLSGWLYNSMAGPLFAVKWFGLFRVPSIWHADPDLKAWARDLHETAFWVLAAFVALHAAAAFKHHYIDKDETLRRMLPGMPPPDRGTP